MVRDPSHDASLRLTELTSPERIRVPLRSSGKDGIIRELVDLLAGAAELRDPQEVARAVRARERVLSTGVGRGIAIPHAQCAAVDRLYLAAGLTDEPVDFDSLDGEAVRIVFLLVAPETSAGLHVKVLREISRTAGREDVRRRLLEVDDARDFYRILQEAEEE